MTLNLTRSGVVGVIGAGTMGSGIALVAASAGHEVKLVDANPDALDTAVAEIEQRLRRDVERDRRSPPEAEAIEARIRPGSSLAACAPASLVIEAIVEDLSVKTNLFRSLERVVASNTILATNTSSLSVSDIASGLDHPERFVGMHFFNPATLMPLVEVVKAPTTSDEIVAKTAAVAAAWGKTPVVCRSSPGFIVNRVARPFYGEALRIVEEGTATAATVDAIARDAGGFRMGPFQLMDLVGLDVNLAVSTSVYEQTGDSRFRPSGIQRDLVTRGALGRKSGRGFYDYSSGPTPALEAPLPYVDPAEIGGPVLVSGPLGHASGLATRLGPRADIRSTHESTSPGWIVVGEAVVVPTDGRSGVELVDLDIAAPEHIVVLDLALDWTTATSVAIAQPDGADPRAAAAVSGLLRLAGVRAVRVADTPGLVMMRIMAQLASVAADAAALGVARPSDIDTAMRLGTNYPVGPLEWADSVGHDQVVAVLGHLRDHYGENRYDVAHSLRTTTEAEGELPPLEARPS